MKINKMILSVAAAACLFSASAFSQDLPAWVKRMKISGDLGVRTEVINDEKSSNEDLHHNRLRERVRFRLGFDTNPSDKVKVAFGIETVGSGTSNPTSGWVDFNDFQKQPVYLSHAYVQYAPVNELTLSAGVIKGDIPFWKPVQLVWRNDVNPIGASANIKASSGKVNFFANAALFALTANRYWYDNETSDVPMHAVVVAQPGLEYKEKNFSLKGAFAIQQFSLTGHPSSWISSDRSFTLINPTLELKLSKLVSSYGITFNGEFSKNVNDCDINKSPRSCADETANDNTNTYLLQVGFGSDRVSAPKDWQIKAAYRRLENNALPRGMGQVDAYNADPGKGWEYYLTLGLIKDLSFNASFFIMTDIDGNRPQNVCKFDLIYKF